MRRLSPGEWLSALGALAACAARLSVPTRPASAFGWPLTCEALAHVFVGGLLGAWLAGAGRFFLWLALGVTAFEIGCFLLLR